MHLPHRLVNKLPVHAPDPTGWHHAHVADPLANVGWQEEENVYVGEENKALIRRSFEARVKTDLDALDKMPAPDFVSHTKVLPGHKPDREG